MLRILRIVLATIVLCCLVILFADTAGLMPGAFPWLAKIQFVPALLAMNVLVIAGLIIVTLVFGRVYCSVICPLGISQDVISRLRIWLSPKRKRKLGVYKYTPAARKTRLLFLGFFVAVLILGLLNVMAISLGAIIEPYSIFGRIITALVSPLYDYGYNHMAERSIAEGEYMYMPIARAVSTTIFFIALVSLLVVVAFAITAGRRYCNTICPVGTLLGFLSRYSLFRITIDTTKCNSCRQCERHCKGQCIDARNHAIDYSRCVVCMDCVGQCRQGAVQYAIRASQPVVEENNVEEPAECEGNEAIYQTISKGRRNFMATLGLLTGALAVESTKAAVEKLTDGGLTPLKNRQSPPRKIRVLPPGAISQANLNARCVGCQLCIQHCPEHILSPSTQIATFMQPEIDFTKSFCQPDCVKCTQMCPTGALQPLDVPLKSSWKTGTAEVNLEMCLSANGTDYCGNCARHCPAGAIEMMPISPGGDDLAPVVNANLCIGCGACENHCPVGTVASMEESYAAIHVEGIYPQRKI